MGKTNSSLTISLSLDQYFESSILSKIEQMVTVRVEESLGTSIEKMVAEKVSALADKQFEKLAKSKLEEYFIKSLKKTNMWGDPTGESTSLVEVLKDQFAKFLDQQVDDKGNPSNYSGDKLKRHQWMLNKLAHEPLKQAIDDTDETKTKASAGARRAARRFAVQDQGATDNNIEKLTEWYAGVIEAETHSAALLEALRGMLEGCPMCGSTFCDHKERVAQWNKAEAVIREVEGG